MASKSRQQYNKTYYQEHKQEVKIKVLNWRAKNPEKYAAIIRKSQKKYRLAIIGMLGNKCIRCGFTDIRALQIDHIDGKGYEERRGLKTNRHKIILEQLMKGSENYQILCANCNWIKRIENKENRK